MSQILQGARAVKVTLTCAERSAEPQLRLGGVHEADEPLPGRVQLFVDPTYKTIEKVDERPLTLLALMSIEHDATTVVCFALTQQQGRFLLEIDGAYEIAYKLYQD